MTRDEQLAAWGGKDWFRMELAMDYSEPFRCKGAPGVEGAAGCRWSVLADREASDLSVQSHSDWTRLQAILLGFLYARVLTTLDAASRAELFRRIDDAAGAMFETKRFGAIEFEPWKLRGRIALVWPVEYPIWPWTLESWREVESRKSVARVVTYTSTMMLGPSTPVAPDGRWLRLDWDDLAFNRSLYPATPLLATALYWREADEKDRIFLITLLREVNHYYHRPENAGVDSDGIAVLAAIERLLGVGPQWRVVGGGEGQGRG